MPRKNNVKATPEMTRFLVPEEKSHRYISLLARERSMGDRVKKGRHIKCNCCQSSISANKSGNNLTNNDQLR